MRMASGPGMIGHELGNLRLALLVLRIPFAWLIMLASFLVTLAVIGLLATGAWWLASGWNRANGPGWMEWVLGGLGSTVVLVAGWFVFPLVVTAVAGLFLEPLADRIERLYYPELPLPRHVPIREQILASLRVLARNLGWNLLGLPLYFIPFVNVAAYAAINGFLLSSEYFQVVALRHLPTAEAKALYRRHRRPLWRGGLVLAFLFIVPGLNLAAPLLATAWMVHRLWRRADAPLRLARPEAAIPCG